MPPVRPGRRGERDFAARRCPPPLLVYPQAPGHRVVLAVERYGMALPWVPGLRRVSCVLLLPPTVMSRGLVTWVNPLRSGRTTAVQGRRCVRGVAYRAARVPTRPVGHLAVTYSPES